MLRAVSDKEHPEVARELPGDEAVSIRAEGLAPGHRDPRGTEGAVAANHVQTTGDSADRH